MDITSSLRRLRPATVALVVVASGLAGTVVVTSDVEGAPPALRADEFDLGFPDPSTYLVFGTDGRTFGEGEEIAVFGGLTWVPGDRQRSRFWIRNDGPDPGDVYIRLILGPDDRLATRRAFSLKVRGRFNKRSLSPDITRLMLPNRARASELVQVANHLRPGRRTRIAVVGKLSFSAGNNTMRRLSDMTLQFRMEQDPQSRAGRGEQTRKPPGRDRG